MSTRRFSKAQVSEWARGRMDRLSENYSFDLNKGWAQVDRSLPTDIEHNRGSHGIAGAIGFIRAMNTAEKKRCMICHKSKAIHFYRAGEWRKEKWNRCTECLRVKKPTGGGTEYWRRTMRGVMA